MEDELNAVIIKLGFCDLKEFHKLSSSVPFLTIEDRARFVLWKETDGTKKGLLKLFKAKP